MKIFYFACLILLGAVACNKTTNNANTETTTQENTSACCAGADSAKLALDYFGVYEGLTPCADCEGIKVLLTLKQDTTYTLKNAYMKDGKETNPSEYIGKFKWNTDGQTITLEGIENAPSQFTVQEGKLVMLDMEGKKACCDSLSNLYVLKQIEVFNK